MRRESLKLLWRDVVAVLWTDVSVLFRRRPRVCVITFDFTDH